MSRLLKLFGFHILLLISALNLSKVYGDDPPPAPAAAPEAAKPAGNSTGGELNPLVLKGWDNPRTKANNSALLSPDDGVIEDPKVQEDILKMEKSHCDHVYVYCMEHLQNLHRHIKPEKLEDKCFKQMKGFLICINYTKEDTAKAKENVESSRPGSATVAPAAPPAT